MAIGVGDVQIMHTFGHYAITLVYVPYVLIFRTYVYNVQYVLENIQYYVLSHFFVSSFALDFTLARDLVFDRSYCSRMLQS